MNKMKRILALTLSLLMILTSLPVFAETADDNLAAIPGTLVDSHGFFDSDIPGHKIVHGYSDTTNFSGKYTDDGFVLNRETKMASGTGSLLSGELMRINLTKKVGDEYLYGLEGKYAIDLTVNGHLSSGMNSRDVYLDGYMVCSDSMEALPTECNTNVKIRFIAEQNKTGNTHFQVLSASNSSIKTDLAPIPIDTDTVIRLIIDSETGDVELYTSVDNKQTFVSYGSLDGVFTGDKIQGFVFNPGLALLKEAGKTSTMTFKQIDVYEINIAEVKFFVDGSEYETVKVNAGGTVSSISAPAKENYVFDGWYLEGADTAFDFATPIENDINLYAKYTENEIIPEPDPATAPGTLVDSHGFFNSDIPGRKIINNYTDTTNYSGKYTADGFVLNRETTMASGTGTLLSNELMRINLTKKVGDEYQYGLEGRYAIDLTVNGHLSSGMSLRDVYLDGYMVSSEDMETLPTEGNTNVIIRFIAEQNRTGNTHFQVLSALNSNLKTDLAPIPVDTDTVIRLIIDSETGNVELFTSIDNKQTFVSYGSLEGVFKGDKIQSFVFNPGLGLLNQSGKTSTMTFKKIDIYEINIAEVKFYVDGIEYETVEVNAGSTVSSLSAPAKENYVFDGWYLEGADTEFDFTTPIEEDMILYAKYKGVTSSIVFKADDNIIATLTGEFGSIIEGTIPEVPAKEGYTVVGWYVDDVLYNPATPIDSTEIVVVAKYEKGNLNNYTVTFKVDGENYATANAFEGYAISDVPEDPVKDNYIFKGWALGDNIFDMNTPITSNITLNAMFEPKDINITYYVDDSMSEVYKTETGKYSMVVGTLPVPVRNTYKFLGWKNVDGTDFTEEQILTEDISVYGVWESTIKVVLDEDLTKYGSLTGGNNVEFSLSGSVTELSYDNGAKMTWIKKMPTSRTLDQDFIVKFKVPLGEEDTVNRTRVFNNKLVGDYEVEVEMDVKLSGVEWDSQLTGAPFGQYSTGLAQGSGFTGILANRIGSTAIQTYNNATAANSDFNATNTLNKSTAYAHSKTSVGKLDDGAFKSVVNRIRYDSTRAYAEMTAPGQSEVSYGASMSPVTGINAFRYSMMACFAPGDYIRVKRVKVTQYNVDETDADYLTAMDILAQLPDSIVAEGDTAYSVTKSLEIPNIKGVSWLSSNRDTVDVTTGEISKWYNPQDVAITAKVNAGNYEFTKEYKLTISPVDGIVKETILDETFTSEEDLVNWSFVSHTGEKIAEYSVDENGIKIQKVTAPEIPDYKYETQRYFAFYDLYTEQKDDAYTTTYTKDVQGVYDVSINIGDYMATSKVPLYVGVGYRSGNKLSSYGAIVFSKDSVKFTYNRDAETIVEYAFDELSKDAVATIRVDNILGEIALIIDGNVVVRNPFNVLLSENVMINSVRVALDLNNEIGNGVTIKGIKVDKYIENRIPAIDDAVEVADSLTIGTVTSNPDALSGSINKLPETIGGYKVDWKSSSNQVDVETCEVFHASSAKEVILTAEVYDADAQFPVVVRKDFKVTVRAAVNDAELGQYDINSLGRITNQNYNDIRYDLTLPKADNVTWKSSNTSIITDEGKLVETAVVTEPTMVKITAISNNVTKDYNLTVSPRTELVSVVESALPATIKFGNMGSSKVSADTTVEYTYTHNASVNGKVNVVNENGDVLVSMVAVEDGIYFDYKNSDYKKIALEDGKSVNIKFIIMPDVDKVAVIADDVVVADYSELKVATNYVAGVESTNDTLNTGAVKVSVDKYGILQANIDNIDYFTDTKYGYAIAPDVNLPTNTITSSKVTWTSSNTAVLKDDGTVIEPDKLTNVTLQFKIEDPNDSRIFITKEFDICVDTNNSKNIVYGIVPTITTIEDDEYPRKNMTDNNIKTSALIMDVNKEDGEIVFKLNGTSTFNSMFISNVDGGIDEYEIYASSNGTEWTEVYKGTFGNKTSEFAAFNVVSASYIKLVVKKGDVKDVYIDEVKVFLSATKDELAQMDIELITVPAVAEGSKINLPATGVNGTTITWTSSDESVIDNKGNVTRPSSSTTVTLTATVMVDGKAVTKDFEVFVDTKSTSGPTQVGGGSGGGGGAGGSSSGAVSKPVIGTTTDDTVYSEPEKEEEVETIVSTKYSDVKPTDWYYDAVTTLTEKGVVSGDGTGKFNPQDNVTREQFVKMILVALDVEMVEGENKFIDVDENAWYVDYIVTANKLGIVNGLAETYFGVGSNITRQDMAVLVERVLNYSEITLEKAETEPFADEANVADYAKEAVANMKAIGLIKGYENKYNPKDNLTRAEAATVITTLLELLAK